MDIYHMEEQPYKRKSYKETAIKETSIKETAEFPGGWNCCCFLYVCMRKDICLFNFPAARRPCPAPYLVLLLGASVIPGALPGASDIPGATAWRPCNPRRPCYLLSSDQDLFFRLSVFEEYRCKKQYYRINDQSTHFILLSALSPAKNDFICFRFSWLLFIIYCACIITRIS